LSGVVEGSASGATAASSLVVLAAHAGSVVVSCFDRAGEASHLILAVVGRAVALGAAGVEPTNGGTQAGGARRLPDLHPWREGVLQEDAT
jgi:hypothetical protein